LKKKYIYYWSPFLTKIATIKAVLSSAESLVKYSNEFQPTIINAAGEFDEYIYKIKKQVTVSELELTFDYYTKIPKEQVHASFVEQFIQKSDEKYITTNFINEFKEGDVVTLNYINENGNKYYR
jgi:hypothetical protein